MKPLQKQRRVGGAAAAGQILTEAKVREIKRILRYEAKERARTTGTPKRPRGFLKRLADANGVAKRTIEMIIIGRSWGHVK